MWLNPQGGIPIETNSMDINGRRRTGQSLDLQHLISQILQEMFVCL